MAQETLQVDTQTFSGSWSIGAGASFEAAVQLPDDEDTAFIVTSAGASSVSYKLAATVALQVADVVNVVRVVSRSARGSGSGNPSGQVFLDNSDGQLDSGTYSVASTSYVDFTFDFATDPLGSTWTKASIDDLTITMERVSGGSRQVKTTSLYVIVDYTPGATTKVRRGFGVRSGSRTVRG